MSIPETEQLAKQQEGTAIHNEGLAAQVAETESYSPENLDQLWETIVNSNKSDAEKNETFFNHLATAGLRLDKDVNPDLLTTMQDRVVAEFTNWLTKNDQRGRLRNPFSLHDLLGQLEKYRSLMGGSFIVTLPAIRHALVTSKTVASNPEWQSVLSQLHLSPEARAEKAGLADALNASVETEVDKLHTLYARNADSYYGVQRRNDAEPLKTDYLIPILVIGTKNPELFTQENKQRVKEMFLFMASMYIRHAGGEETASLVESFQSVVNLMNEYGFTLATPAELAANLPDSVRGYGHHYPFRPLRAEAQAAINQIATSGGQ